MATNKKSSVTQKQVRGGGDVHPTSAFKSHMALPINHSSTGEDFNGDWPDDGFIVPGTASADQEQGRGQFVQGSGGRGNAGWKGGN